MNETTMTDARLKECAEKGPRGFITGITDRYKEVIGGQLTADTMPLLTGRQHALLSFRIFSDEVEDGGFIQLIQNGYGPYIFDNPFAKAMRLMGLKDFSKLIYKAKEIYDKNREELEKDIDEDEFMALYEQYDNLGDLCDEFLVEQEDIINVLAYYVDEHLEEFITVRG